MIKNLKTLRLSASILTFNHQFSILNGFDVQSSIFFLRSSIRPVNRPNSVEPIESQHQVHILHTLTRRPLAQVILEHIDVGEPLIDPHFDKQLMCAHHISRPPELVTGIFYDIHEIL